MHSVLCFFTSPFIVFLSLTGERRQIVSGTRDKLAHKERKRREGGERERGGGREGGRGEWKEDEERGRREGGQRGEGGREEGRGRGRKAGKKAV